MSNSPNNARDEEDRYMALLALTSQELPPTAGKPFDWRTVNLQTLTAEQRDALQRWFDAHPDEFEQFLVACREQNGVTTTTAPHSPPPRWRWFPSLWPAPLRVAGAFASVLAVAILVLLQLSGPPPFATGVNQSFASLQQVRAGSPLPTVMLPWDQQRAELGFSGAAADTPSAVSFAAGLLDAREAAASGAAQLTTADDPYFALGQWNVLLNIAAAQEPVRRSGSFWQQQLMVHDALQKGLTSGRTDPFVLAHVQRLHPLLTDLARQQRPARTAHNLTAELQSLREQFAARDVNAARRHAGGQRTR